MSRKGNNFFEEHIEKLVLAIVGLVCIWLLVMRVLFSPNVVRYDNKNFSPGGIDVYISEQAGVLEDKLTGRPEPPQAYNPRFGDFVARVDSAIADIDVSVGLPLPPLLKDVRRDNRVYSVPLIGEVNEVSVEHIRAVAYVPIGKIDEENVYDGAESEPADIDFVTVEAKFDVAGLCKRFNESFAGEDVQEEWRDEELANPIFAAVQLQRQELLADGGWSEWQGVPRTKIDARSRMFEVIEKVDGLPAGGMKVRLLKFNDAEARMDLLQPQAYQIASADEEWFPPSLHEKCMENQRKIELQEKREAREEARAERERERGRARAARPSRTPSTRVRSGGIEDEDEVDFGVSVRRERRIERRSDRERSAGPERVRATEPIWDVYSEFNKILILAETDFARMRESLVFWAHDDTCQPEKSYRYRIRLGVFNPIAGTEQFSERDKWQKNNVILWSGFSEETEPVEIPGTLYFFPIAIQEAANMVTVQVCRYALGYWYSRDFAVKQGEVIGKVVETWPEDVGQEEGITMPETIDYATGAVLVDVMPVNDWSGGKNLRARYYFDMLYSFDGSNIEHLPVNQRYWAKEMQTKFGEIEKCKGEPKEPLRGWGSRRGGRRRLLSGVEEEFDEEEDF